MMGVNLILNKPMWVFQTINLHVIMYIYNVNLLVISLLSTNFRFTYYIINHKINAIIIELVK